MMPRQTFYERWFEDWWLGELLAVALCVVLAVYDGKTMPSFGTVFNSGITLNTLVSLLSTLSVAAVLVAVQGCIGQLKWLSYSDASRPLRDLETYDEAIRGLAGSFQLLWKLRLAPVASLGALFVILQLAVVPMAQQSVLSQYHNVSLETNATVAVATFWSEQFQQTQASNMPAGYDALSLGMKGAILGGLFTKDDVELNNTVPACISSNCTFPDYPSLAIYSSTADVTTHLSRTSDDNRTTKYCLPDGYNCLANNNMTLIEANITSAAPYSQVHQSLDLDISDTNALKSLNYNSTAFANHISPIADVYVDHQHE
jgi:hypothetical protein